MEPKKKSAKKDVKENRGNEKEDKPPKRKINIRPKAKTKKAKSKKTPPSSDVEEGDGSKISSLLDFSSES